jgi:hypothetical protein
VYFYAASPKGHQGPREHFGWIDDNSDGFITEAEWNKARSLGAGDFGAIALEPEKLQGQLESSAVRRRFKKHLPPATGEAIKIAAKKVVKFRVAKAAKDAIVPLKAKKA